MGGSMKGLEDARPDASRDREVRLEVNKRFVASFAELLDAIAESGIDINSARRKLDDISPSGKISGMCHVVYDRLLASARDQNGDEIERILRIFPDVPSRVERVNIIGWYLEGYSRPLHELYFDACDESFVGTYGVHFDGVNNSPEEYREARPALN